MSWNRSAWLKTPTGQAYQKRSRIKWQAKKRAAFTAYINAEKGQPCSDCGGRFPPCAMDFDHVRGKKTFSLCRGGSKSMARCIAEVAKCDLVCANCHRIRTSTRRCKEAV